MINRVSRIAAVPAAAFTFHVPGAIIKRLQPSVHLGLVALGNGHSEFTKSTNSSIHLTGDLRPMTTNSVQLELDPRELTGKKVGRLRRAGIVPVHLYGPGMTPRSLQCQTSQLIQVLAKAGGATAITITIQGEVGTHLAFAREIQWDPRRDDLLHVDLLAADVSRPVTAQVPVILTGESAGARSVSGTVMQQLRTIDVQALPLEMPSQIEMDLEVMEEADSVIRVADLIVPGSATVLTDSEELVARIELPRVVEEVFGEGTEGEEGLEGEAGESEGAAEE